MAWRGSPDLERLLVPLDELRPHPDNPRRGNVERIAQSLSRFGQVRPIVALLDGTIVAGNHTWQAAKTLGWEKIACVRVELSEQEARAYLIADNRTADLADYEEEILSRVLADLAEGDLLEAAGWTYAEYDDLLAQLEQPVELPPEPFSGGYAEDPEETARREGDKSAWIPKREVVLLLSEEEYAEFGVHVRVLREAWGTSGVVETVREAVRRAASSLGEEEG